MLLTDLTTLLWFYKNYIGYWQDRFSSSSLLAPENPYPYYFSHWQSYTAIGFVERSKIH